MVTFAMTQNLLESITEFLSVHSLEPYHLIKYVSQGYLVAVHLRLAFLLLFLSSEDIYVYIPHFHWEQMNFFKMNLVFGYFIHADNMLQPHPSFHCLRLLPSPPLSTVSFSPPAQSLVSISLSDGFVFVLWHTRFNKGQLCGHG